MTTAEKQSLERDPGFWWLRLTYAIRGGDLAGAAEAQRRLSALGIDVSLRSLEAFLAREAAK